MGGGGGGGGGTYSLAALIASATSVSRSKTLSLYRLAKSCETLVFPEKGAPTTAKRSGYGSEGKSLGSTPGVQTPTRSATAYS